MVMSVLLSWVLRPSCIPVNPCRLHVVDQQTGCTHVSSRGLCGMGQLVDV